MTLYFLSMIFWSIVFWVIGALISNGGKNVKR